MRIFPKIVKMLCFSSIILFSCSKSSEVTEPTMTQNAPQAVENTDFTYDQEFLNQASERGNCGTVGAKVEFLGSLEYEFDVAFSGWGVIHFFNTPSGTIKTKDGLPPAVQTRYIFLTNKPDVKQNPKCPWIGKPKGDIKITLMMVQKNKVGSWEQIPGTNSISYTLGSSKPTQILQSGGRVFCLDQPIGKWQTCSLLQ
jgi:hypothetical protein